MREFLNVFAYTFFENARKKVFIISTVIILLLTVAVLNIPAAMRYFGNTEKSGSQSGTVQPGNERNKSAVYMIDTKKILNDDLLKLETMFAGYAFKPETPDKTESLKEDIKNGKGSAVIVLDEKDGAIYLDYWVKNSGSGLNPDNLSRAIRDIHAGAVLNAANVPETVTNKALSSISYHVNELGKGMIQSFISSIVVIMLLFFAVYFYGYSVAMSVASEKTSRVMEILITSTKPSRIVLGKSAAMGLLGLLQLLLIVLSAVATYVISFPPDFLIGGQKLEFSNFTLLAVVFLIVYFILGYSLYAMMNAVAGATVSKAEDVNAAIMPINMITLIAFYFAYAAVGFPDGQVATVASIIPFSAPFSMPCRILMTDVPAWQIAVSVAIMVITIILTAFVSIRLYSSAVLHYGNRLKLKDLFKMSKQS